MIAVSRKRTYREERSSDTAVAKTKRTATITGKSSQVHCGETPNARMKMRTTTRLTARLNRLVRTTASGITRRGNCVFRTTPSWLTTERTDAPVDSEKKPKRTTFIKQQHRIVRHA